MQMQIVLVLIYTVSCIYSDAIPYSYSKGRNVTAVEVRFKQAEEARSRGTLTELVDICGKVDLTKRHCTTRYGRPRNSETLACDSLCCMQGYKIGNCGTEVGEIGLDRSKLFEIMQAAYGSGLGPLNKIPDGILNVDIGTGCFCSNDPIDVRCGRDGSFMGIRCPDKSACWRHCCRKGYEIGKCTGFFKLQCDCENKLY